jgi:hypothetical protein
MKKERIMKFAKFIGENEIIERYKAKTPRFFKRFTKVGLVCVAVGGVVATAPISLPASIVALGGYLATLGGAIVAIAPMAKED